MVSEQIPDVGRVGRALSYHEYIPSPKTFGGCVERALEVKCTLHILSFSRRYHTKTIVGSTTCVREVKQRHSPWICPPGHWLELSFGFDARCLLLMDSIKAPRIVSVLAVGKPLWHSQAILELHSRLSEDAEGVKDGRQTPGRAADGVQHPLHARRQCCHMAQKAVCGRTSETQPLCATADPDLRSYGTEDPPKSCYKTGACRRVNYQAHVLPHS